MRLTGLVRLFSLVVLLPVTFVTGCSQPAAVQAPPSLGPSTTGTLSPDQARAQFQAGQASDPTPMPASSK